MASYDAHKGLSPYTRGNLTISVLDMERERSIPVHTGKPSFPRASITKTMVYPRTHGETKQKYSPYMPERGLSPYTRGNRCAMMGAVLLIGSIPVHTGKPKGGILLQPNERVYPRTHGETMVKSTVVRSWSGLSPYTRGNPYQTSNQVRQPRSIPVHTGKPAKIGSLCRRETVYPRTHGETTLCSPTMLRASGLSPYTRGNLPMLLYP